jgi:membrane associated rhomboid family serine protease
MAIFGSLIDDLRHTMRTGNMMTRLVLINFVIFVLVKIIYLLTWVVMRFQPDATREVFNKGLNWFCMPGSFSQLIWQPWALFTSFFLHESFWHLLNNIICLYIFGSITGDLVGDRKVLPIYLLGGLTGNLVFLLSAQFLPYVGVASYALGASGAIMALAGAALIIAPDYRVMLFLLGEVKLKYIVLIMLLLDMVSIADQINTGGHAAHLGGFIMGCLIIYQLHDGRDWTLPVNRVTDTISGWFSRKKTPFTAPKRFKQPAFKTKIGGNMPPRSNEPPDMSFQEKLDTILDKIKQNGYENLTQEEKDFLYDASKK